MNDEPQLTILNIINTRWLSMSNVVHNLHQIIFSVIDALNDDLANGENPKDKDWASQLINNLDPNFIISTMFMADLRSEEHTSELQSQSNLVCRLLLEKTT